MMQTAITATVSRFRQVTPGGRHIRWATKVTFSDGFCVKYCEIVPKNLAIRQAQSMKGAR